MHRAPKTDHARRENRWTQPLRTRRAFGRCDVITAGWYPACRARALRAGAARSVRIGGQRLALFRDDRGVVHALDAFCPHMGTDLGNGHVEGGVLRCPLHGWRFDGDGACVATGSGGAPPPGTSVRRWPVHEALGTVWVFAGETPTHPFPTSPALEGVEVASICLGRTTLYAHHHAMMTGGIDLQHFHAVHGLDIRFDHETTEPAPGVLEYRLEGTVPPEGWRGRIGNRLVGDRFRYGLRVAGGSVAAISYGMDQRLGGSGRPLPALNVLWGCVPTDAGVSEVEVHLLTSAGRGLSGRLAAGARLATTLGLLAVLDDDDRRAFPNMRFDPGRLTAEDAAVVTMIRHLDALPIASWSVADPAAP